MPKVSKISLDQDELRRIRDAFLGAIASLRTRGDVEEFLQDFLTPSEWRMLMKRLAIAERLLANDSYDKIRQKLKVSNTTIARMRNFLTIHGNGLRKMIQKLQSRS